MNASVITVTARAPIGRDEIVVVYGTEVWPITHAAGTPRGSVVGVAEEHINAGSTGRVRLPNRRWARQTPGTE